jgi:two-component sensor histidine kinase
MHGESNMKLGSLHELSRRFKRNCMNSGSLLEKSNMKLTKWEDLEVPRASISRTNRLSSIVAKSLPLIAGQIDWTLAFQLRHVIVPVEAYSVR